MKNEIKLFVVGVTGMLLMTTCSQNQEAMHNMQTTEIMEEESLYTTGDVADASFQMTEETESASTTLPNFVSSGAASAANDDGVHKLIRTASLRFKVKDVATATQQIEDVVLRRGGIILNSTIVNENPYMQTVTASKDSIYRIYHSNLKATLNLRVPYRQLDSTLRQIAPLALVIDYRKINAEDVTARLMADQLKKARLEKKQGRLSNAIATRSGKLESAMTAEETLDNALAEAAQTRISEFMLNDRIQFSSIHLELYQDMTSYTEKVVNRESKIKPYTPGLGTQMLDALKDGLSMLKNLLIFVLTGWPLCLIAAVGIYIYRVVKKRRQ